MTLHDSSLKSQSIVDAIRSQMSYEKNYSLNAIKWIAEMGSSCPPFADYMILHGDTFRDMLFTLRNARNSQ